MLVRGKYSKFLRTISSTKIRNNLSVLAIGVTSAIILIISSILFTTSANADTMLYTFTNLSDYTFDTDNIEFISGKAQLKVRNDWYDNSWTERKAIAINNNNNPNILTDYQVKVTLPYSSSMQNNFRDIRFTDETGKNLLDYWLESKVDSSQAIFWVKVPSIPANDTSTIYAYYGNPEAISISNPNNVFLFFDDAESGDINTKWEAVSGTPRFQYTNTLTYKGNWFQDLVTNYHGPMTTYTDRHRPMGIFIPSERKTFFVFGSADQYAEIGEYNHLTKSFSNPVKIGFIGEDAHKNPSIFIDDNGYIYVFYGSHNTTLYTRRSVYPYNIYSWEAAGSIPGHTYPQSWQLKSNEIIHFYRGTDRRGHYRISYDNASTWGDPVRWIDFGGADGANWTYAMTIAENGTYPRTVHATWTIREGAGLPRRNVYYARSEDGGSTWRKSDGTLYSLPITGANAEKILDSGTNEVQSSDLQVDSQGNVYALYTEGYQNNCIWKILRLTRATQQWSTFNVGASCDHQFDIGALIIKDDNDFRLYLPSVPVQPGEDGGDIEEWQSTNKGSTWTKRKDITSGSIYSHNFIRSIHNSDSDFRAFWGYADSSPNAPDRSSVLYYYGSNSPVAQPIAKGAGNSTILLNGGDEENIIRAKNLNLTDFILEADVRPMHRLSVLTTRVDLTGNNYSLRATYEDSRIHLYENDNYTELANTTKKDHQDFHKWTVKMIGNRIDFSWDETNLLNTTDPNNSISSGSIGARVRNGSIEMDNVRVRKYTSVEPTTTISKEVGIYPNDNPSITPIQSNILLFEQITQFSAVASPGARFQLSNNGGETWYWYNNLSWQTASGGYDFTNTGTEIGHNIATFPKGEGFFTFKAYLGSDGNTPTNITSVDLIYTTLKDSSLGDPPEAPTHLLTDNETNPVNIKDTPNFKAQFNDSNLDDTGTEYRIEVNSNATFTGISLWDSGRIPMNATPNGSMSPDLQYNGNDLETDGKTYYWRIKFWDNTGLESIWSREAQFTMTNTNNLNPPNLNPPNQSTSPTDTVYTNSKSTLTGETVPKTALSNDLNSKIVFGGLLMIFGFSISKMDFSPSGIPKGYTKTKKRRKYFEKSFEKNILKT